MRKKRNHLLVLLPLCLLLGGCPPSGESLLYVQAVANLTNTEGFVLKNVASPSFPNGVLTDPEAFYLDITAIRLKSAVSNWIDVAFIPSGPVDIAGGFTFISGVPVPADDYRAILIEYRPTWSVRFTYESWDYAKTNATSLTQAYILLGQASDIAAITNTELSSSNTVVGILEWPLSFFGGDSVVLHLYFDTLGMVEVLTDPFGYTNAFLHAPFVDYEIN